MTNDGDKKITVGEAAELLGISRRGVIGAIERGRIKAEKFGMVYAVSKNSVLEYKVTRGHAPGRPKQQANNKG